MLIEDIPNPQDINLTLTVGVKIMEGKKATISIPHELRLTPKVFHLLSQLVEAQGLELGNMNISEQHKQEIRDLPNVVLVDKQEP